MKSRLLILSLVVLLFGCAKIKEVKQDINACYDDPVCFAKAVEKAKVAGNQASDLAGLSGFPWATKVAKPVAGYAVLIFTLAVLGKKKRKEEVTNG